MRTIEANLEQRCRIKAVWRQDGAVGGAFLSIGELAADPSSGPSAPQRMRPT